MGTKKYLENSTANESVSKYKLLSAYGGPGSLVHTQYGSIIISCIEEWGFLKTVLELHVECLNDPDVKEENIKREVYKQSRKEKNGNIGISNDSRLLGELVKSKALTNLKYLALIPDIEIVTHNNKIKTGVEFSIASSYMPKVFADSNNNYKPYSKWYKEWVERRHSNGGKIDEYGKFFHPPKYNHNEGKEKEWIRDLKQDNIILLCEHGHISDFPWSKFLRWRTIDPNAIFEEVPVDMFGNQDCCTNPNIKITSNTGNASGFDGKFIRCINAGCIGEKGISLKGLMGVKIKCAGHKPWEATTGNIQYHSGDLNVRRKEPPTETCKCEDVKGKLKPMKVSLTTGNNIYYSRILSSIFLHSELFESDTAIEIMRLEEEKKILMSDDDTVHLAPAIIAKIKELKAGKSEEESESMTDSESEMVFRFNEFKAFHQNEDLLNLDTKHLKTKDVTGNLNKDTSDYFDTVLRIDNMKITSAQLDFSRVFPLDADAESAYPKNIFRSPKDQVEVYPVVESFGEGIFFSFNSKQIDMFCENNKLIDKMKLQLTTLQKGANDFNKGAIDFANIMNWQMYLVHSFSHLIMRELEFRCGYPTASLSERIYVSNDVKYKMYGCLIYTAEGAEGSMGGLIAQTRPQNLNNLIKSAVNRATICNSDPLCWASEGQGLFDLNFASCFSCSLVSETSCEHRNLYLDRTLLVDKENGFFKDLIN
jgi:hypothetical protein